MHKKASNLEMESMILLLNESDISFKKLQFSIGQCLSISYKENTNIIEIK